jgi:hypothetical protein
MPRRVRSLLEHHFTLHKEFPVRKRRAQGLVKLEDSQGRYGITSLKREPKDFGWREMTQELCRRQQLQPLYDIASRLLPHLQISNESVTYYATLATYYTVFRLKQVDEDLVRMVTQARFDETAFQRDDIDGLALPFKRHLRPLLLAVEFGAASVRDPRIAAVPLLKAAFQKGKALEIGPDQRVFGRGEGAALAAIDLRGRHDDQIVVCPAVESAPASHNSIRRTVPFNIPVHESQPGVEGRGQPGIRARMAHFVVNRCHTIARPIGPR